MSPLFGPPDVGKMEARGDFRGLVKALQSSSFDIQIQAREALVRLKDPRTIDSMLQILEKEKEQGLRQLALMILGYIPDERAVPKVQAALQEPDLALFAAMALQKILGARSLPSIIACMDHPETKVRLAGIQAIQWLRPEYAMGGKIAEHDESAIEPLIAALKDPEAPVRLEAAKAMTMFKDARAVPNLISLLQDGSTAIREAAADALRYTRDQGAMEGLIDEFLQQTDQTRKNSYARALAGYCDLRVYKAFFSCAECLNSARSVRGSLEISPEADAGTKAWGIVLKAVTADEYWVDRYPQDLKPHGDAVIEPLCLYVRNLSWNAGTLEKLGKIKEPWVVDLLIDGLDDRDEDIRKYSVWNLQSLYKEGGLGAETKAKILRVKGTRVSDHTDRTYGPEECGYHVDIHAVVLEL